MIDNNSENVQKKKISIDEFDHPIIRKIATKILQIKNEKEVDGKSN